MAKATATASSGCPKMIVTFQSTTASAMASTARRERGTWSRSASASHAKSAKHE